jgi:hypothetical protein
MLALVRAEVEVVEVIAVVEVQMQVELVEINSVEVLAG